jgi:2-oxo-3-hexenedioate decarboxylase/2-keto-4-pentenoate hydratase
VEAANYLARARISRARFASLPDALRPQSEHDAYLIQDQVRHALSATFGPQVGYKIGCTTKVMQDYLGIDHPCGGTIYSGGLKRSGETLPARDYVRPGIECEIDVELGRALEASSAPFDLAAVSDAVGAIFAAIEIVDDRYVDWRSLGTPTLIADDFFHAGLVLGDRVLNRQNQNNSGLLSRELAALLGVTWVNGVEVGRGNGRDILGEPLHALVWLANHCAKRGVSLPAGTLVSLGSLVQTQWLNPGDRVEIEIERLGRVSLTISDA